MVDYKKMYYIMVDASERAITAITQQNYGIAKKALIQAEQAEQAAEEMYIETAEEESEEAE